MATKRFSVPVPGPPRKRSWSWMTFAVAAMSLPVVLCASAAVAQVAADDGIKKLPPSVEIHKEDPGSVTTRDGVKLAATFFPGTKGKDSVPVILLHGYKGSSSDYNQLASHLQSQGHAVLVPDLRGHGDSTERIGSPAVLDAAKMPPVEFIRMLEGDMEVLKDFLWKKNNEQKLNIEKLCIVGAGMGASVALNWARLDWIRAPIGHVKQGQDVKALVLISPEWSGHGLSMSTAMRAQPLTVRLVDPQLKRALKDGSALQTGMPVQLDFRREVSVLILVGKLDRRALADAKRLHTMLARYHPEPPENERTESKDLYFGQLETKLQDLPRLLGADLGVDKYIAAFIDLRLVKRPFPWSKRVKDPYSQPN